MNSTYGCMTFLLKKFTASVNKLAFFCDGFYNIANLSIYFLSDGNYGDAFYSKKGKIVPQ